ncbi:MAG TPA: hypothetical protein PLU25_06395 [Acidobacteriota bacterium]|nr:hypothetical protein [Acidobacteriota bacterium]
MEFHISGRRRPGGEEPATVRVLEASDEIHGFERNAELAEPLGSRDKPGIGDHVVALLQRRAGEVAHKVALVVEDALFDVHAESLGSFGLPH